jgi:hypothetical protein
MSGSKIYYGISTEQWIQWAKDGKLGEYDEKLITKYANKETIERIFSAVKAPAPERERTREREKK